MQPNPKNMTLEHLAIPKVLPSGWIKKMLLLVISGLINCQCTRKHIGLASASIININLCSRCTLSMCVLSTISIANTQRVEAICNRAWCTHDAPHAIPLYRMPLSVSICEMRYMCVVERVSEASWKGVGVFIGHGVHEWHVCWCVYVCWV